METKLFFELSLLLFQISIVQTGRTSTIQFQSLFHTNNILIWYIDTVKTHYDYVLTIMINNLLATAST